MIYLSVNVLIKLLCNVLVQMLNSSSFCGSS